MTTIPNRGCSRDSNSDRDPDWQNNGLRNVDHLRQMVFDTSYLVLGLGDVYLGAPCAVPVDPRHRYQSLISRA